MNKELLDKINHLAHKQKTVGLTVDEVAEQKKVARGVSSSIS